MLRIAQLLLLTTSCAPGYWKVTEGELAENREWVKKEGSPPTQDINFSKSWSWETK